MKPLLALLTILFCVLPARPQTSTAVNAHFHWQGGKACACELTLTHVDSTGAAITDFDQLADSTGTVSGTVATAPSILYTLAVTATDINVELFAMPVIAIKPIVSISSSMVFSRPGAAPIDFVPGKNRISVVF